MSLGSSRFASAVGLVIVGSIYGLLQFRANVVNGIYESDDHPIYTEIVCKACEANAEFSFGHGASYEDLDSAIAPRDEKAYVRYRGARIRISGAARYDPKASARVALAPDVMVILHNTHVIPEVPDGSNVTVEGCIQRVWFPPFPEYPGILEGRKRRTRNYLQARPVGYIYALEDIRVIKENGKDNNAS